jgi:hypothetical protein
MKTKDESEQSEARFPYTNKPGSLRKFLTMIPQRPKPTSINKTTLQSWGFKDGNDYSIIRVLKTVGLVGADNAPTPDYTVFMHKGTGPAHLGEMVKKLYAPLFEASHTPHQESNDNLENLFNIHSGGASRTMSLQIQTFKALCDHADFSGNGASKKPAIGTSATAKNTAENGGAGAGAPTIHIDLHIHLPGNKSRRDYEYMFEDIARYIYGKATSDAGSNGQTE